MEALVDNVYIRKFRTGFGLVSSWVKDQLWPIYSTGVVLGAVCLIASVHEKTMLADHLYGATSDLGDNTETVTKNATALMEEESVKSVKNFVWGLKKADFHDLHTARGGSAL
eukprot:PhM_4_TR10/c0_g1_i1/m.587